MADERGIDSDSNHAATPDAATPEEQQPEKPASEKRSAPDAGRRFRVRPVIAPRSGNDDRDRDRVESADETELGWGDPSGRRDDDWYRRERPPHHG